MSLRCGCPVDTSAKQKHRPSRQARPPLGSWQSVFLLRGIRILSRSALRMTSRLVIANTYGVRINFRLPVIAKPRKRLWQSVSLSRGLRILSRSALRMTSRLVIANTYDVRMNFRLPVIAKPRKRLWQSVSLSRGLRILSRFAFRMTKRRRKHREKFNIRFINKLQDRLYVGLF